MTNPIYLKSQISALKAYRASLKRGTLSAYICIKPPSFYLFVPFSSFNATFSSESCCQSPSELKKDNHLFAVGDAPSVGFCGKGSNRLLSTLCPAAGCAASQVLSSGESSVSQGSVSAQWISITDTHSTYVCLHRRDAVFTVALNRREWVIPGGIVLLANQSDGWMSGV